MSDMPDQETLIDIVRAVERGMRHEAIEALERLFIDHEERETVLHWIACARVLG